MRMSRVDLVPRAGLSGNRVSATLLHVEMRQVDVVPNEFRPFVSLVEREVSLSCEGTTDAIRWFEAATRSRALMDLRMYDDQGDLIKHGNYDDPWLIWQMNVACSSSGFAINAELRS